MARCIQIAATGGTGTLPDTVYALADDGTIWRLQMRFPLEPWLQLPALPPADPTTEYRGPDPSNRHPSLPLAALTVENSW